MYEIVAYWNARQIYDVLNAVVGIMGQPDFLGLMRVVAIIGLLSAATVALLRMKAEEPIVLVFCVCLFYAILFLPKVRVTINDPRTAEVYTVDNVPLGLGFIAATSNRVGKYMTSTFETAFTPVDDQKFSQNGMLFGARILEEKQKAKFVNPSLAEDLRRFNQNCLVPELQDNTTGLSRLVSSTDIWGEILSGSIVILNPGRIVTFTSGSSFNCVTGVTDLNTRMTAQVNSELDAFGKQMFPTRTGYEVLVRSQLVTFENDLMGASTTAIQSLRQSAMINAYRDGRLSDSADSQAFATTMAIQSSNSAYKTMRDIAEGALPKLRNIIEIVVIAVFPIILLLVLAAGQKGGLVLKSYIMGMLWVQMWAPLYAVINYLMIPQVRNAMTGVMPVSGTPGLTLMNAAQVEGIAISEQALAGMLTMLVPVIAYAIVKGGEMAMSSVASSLMSPASGAAQSQGAAAGLGNTNAGNLNWGNVSSGNYVGNNHTGGSFSNGNVNAGNSTIGNSSIGNSSWNNTSANSHDTSMKVADSSMSSYKTAYGSWTQDSQGNIGSMSMSGMSFGGSGLSTGSQFSRSNEQSSAQMTAAESRVSAMSGQTTNAGFSSSVSSAFRSDMNSAYSKGSESGMSYSQGSSGNASTTNTRSSGSDRSLATGENLQVQSRAGIGGNAGSSANTSENVSGSRSISESGGASSGGKNAAGGPATRDSLSQSKSAGSGKSMGTSASAGTGISVNSMQTDLDTVKNSNNTATAAQISAASQRLQSAAMKVSESSGSSEVQSAAKQFSADVQTITSSSLQRQASRSDSESAGSTQREGTTNSISATQSQNRAVFDKAMDMFGGNGSKEQRVANTMEALSQPGNMQAAVQATMQEGGKASLGDHGVTAPSSRQAVGARGSAMVADVHGDGQGAVAGAGGANFSQVQSMQPGSTHAANVESAKGAANASIAGTADSIRAQDKSARIESGATVAAAALHAADEKGMGAVGGIAFLGGAGYSSSQEREAQISSVAKSNPALASTLESIHDQGTPPTQAQLDYIRTQIK